MGHFFNLSTKNSSNNSNTTKKSVKCVLIFLGIEDIVSDSGVEENIALVTFGGTANIVQHLTNDFSRIRDAIGESHSEPLFI